MRYRFVLLVVLALTPAGCKMFLGPDRTGEFHLSSEKYLAESYYLFGYSYEDSEFYRYPFEKNPLPDIINEGFRVLQGDETIELPGFNTPGRTNGFALVGEFDNLDDARDFYRGYTKVDEELQFSVESDIVEAFQVWIQKTSEGNYAKLLIREAESMEGEEGNKFSEVLIEYTYQPKGTRDFLD
ncbi:MAG: hypothetical protein P1P86_02035 [Bacteroidales bacterium]|nr:hypothetical protein [Bacteroidales bacterium]